MQLAGHKREVDYARMGSTLVIASSLIFAIRTARWPRITCDTAAVPPEWDQELEQSVRMAHRIFSHLLSKSPFLFPHKDVPLYEYPEDVAE